MSSTANMFLRLCKQTNKFWNEHKEAISCVILRSKKFKIQLEITDDFSMKHAKMLLMYQTYLLYNIEIQLKSANAYKAINYFLKRIKRAKQKISDQFFEHIKSDIDID